MEKVNRVGNCCFRQSVFNYNRKLDQDQKITLFPEETQVLIATQKRGNKVNGDSGPVRVGQSSHKWVTLCQ